MAPAMTGAGQSGQKMVLALKQMQIDRLARIARWLLAVVLVIWLARVLADSVLLWMAGPQQTPTVDPSMLRLTTINNEQRGALSPAEIERWKLFGIPPEAAPEQRAIDAPETRLRLELLGLFQHSTPDMARAIIAEQGKDAELFRPGDKVPGNAELVEVLGDRVILRRQGQLETLRLKEPELSGTVSASAPPPRRRSQPVVQENQPEPAQLLPDGDPAQQRAMIIQQLALEPVTEGAAEGYRITAGAPAAMLSSVGLRPGDQILSVNGHPLGEEQGDITALQEAMTSGSASIEVQRGSRRFTVNYPP